MFFSFPILYPYLLNAIVPQGVLPTALRSGSTRRRIPRFAIIIFVLAAMIVTIYYNTITHPFTLADNRHYMFYIFRSFILRYSFIKYLNALVYLPCAWNAIIALGGFPEMPPLKTDQKESMPRSETRPSQQQHGRLPTTQATLGPGQSVSFALIWLLTCTLSLVTAPLVEPRYFIVPWLMWRLHVVSPLPHADAAKNARRERAKASSPSPSWMMDALRDAVYAKHDHRLWLETVWFLLINLVTGYVFLYRGFEWPQEPGKVQRFMW